MFGETFYHKTIYKALVGFGTLFNEIYLVRQSTTGQELEKIKVPITYAPKQKYLVRQTADPNLDREVALTFPRMAFQMKAINYAPQRKQVSTMRVVNNASDVARQMVYTPVPYDLDFELYIAAKNQEDVLQILERILPHFTPKYSITINSIPEMELKDDVDIILKGTPFEDPYDGAFTEDRVIIWTLEFTASINLYGKIRDQSIIRKVQVDMLIPKGDIDTTMAETPRVARVVTEPDPIDALPTDDFGITTTISEYNDGKKYNPVSDTDEPV